uniref:Uncharacterized protein n=1 Tax=Lactuca sativa TaxID=4236 RepID=A0A9R1WFV5_LACSA|nr:hypothetical protein LSAT_V11C200054680 [Lactuca sativa]
MDDVGVIRIGDKDHEANDIKYGFNEFDEAANDFDLGLYQHNLKSNSIVNVEVIEQNVDDEVHEGEHNPINKVHEGEDNAVNMEVTEEFNEKIDFNEMNAINDENVEIRDCAADDGIEDKTKTDEENNERSDESGDNDNSVFWVDENNIILDVEVYMMDFYMDIDLEAKFLEKRVAKHTDNEGSKEDIEELDVIDNDQ